MLSSGVRLCAQKKEDDDDGEEDGDEGGEVQFNYNRNKTLWNTIQ